jgi:outer membrane protein assembly factor BamB
MVMKWLVPVALGAATAAAAALPYGHADFVPTPERPANFRGDPRGGYPGATMPSAFSPTTNLHWKIEPGEGCGAVVVVGKRLYLQAAPNALVCCDAVTGKELWRRTNHAKGLAADSFEALFDSQMERVSEYQRAARKWHALPADQRTGKEADLDQIAAGFPEPWRKRHGGGDPVLLAQIPGAETRGYGFGGAYMICTTPVSDGKRVIVRFPTGIVAAYDLDGTHLWSAATRNVPRPSWCKGGPNAWQPLPSRSACPLLTPEGIVVVSLMKNVVIGFDVETGKERWRVVDPKIHDTYASPVLGRIGGESFVAIGDGAILRARDGFLVFTDEYGTDSPACPVFDKGVFYWVTHAVRVTPGDPPKAELVWSWSLEKLKGLITFPFGAPRLSSAFTMPSIVLVDGKTYFYEEKSSKRMLVIDNASGEVLLRPNFPRPTIKIPSADGRAWYSYSGMTLIGDRLVVGNCRGTVWVYPINDTFAPASVGAVSDELIAHPVAQGSRLYLRSHKMLWCFEEAAKP